MIHRSLRGGIAADYLLADAWFGSKAMIRLSQEAALVAILRMKKNKTKYRVSEYVDGNVVKQEMDVKALYRHCVRKNGRLFQDRHIRLKPWTLNSIWRKVTIYPNSGPMFAYCSSVAQLSQPKPKPENMTGRYSYALIPPCPQLISYNCMLCAGRLRCISKKLNNILSC